jgi:hypothetical protein
MRGKPWSIDEERHLRQLVEEGNDIDKISQVMGKTRISVRAKMYNLRLLLVDATVVQNAVASVASVASSPALNADVVPVQDSDGVEVVEVVASHLKATGPLPSVEEKLRVVDSALVALERPGLRAAEISRLHNIIQGVKVYQQLFADFVNYRALESEVLELRKQLASEKNQS